MVKAKDEKGIKDEVEKTDRNRSAYYNYYTQNRWGDVYKRQVFIVRAQRRLLNAGCGLFQHGGLPGGIVDGQTVRPLIFGYL